MSTPAPVPAAAGERFLDGKVAIVTGASRGIGKAIAERLALRGAKLACVATEAKNCAETVARCQAAGATAVAMGVDVSSTKAVGELVEQIQKELGEPYVLVNNAGLTRDQLLLRMSEEDFDRVIAVNLKGAWNFTKACARPLMKSRGRIVNISSVAGAITGVANRFVYCATKAAILGLTKSVARDFIAQGIRCNAVCPGTVDTPSLDTRIRAFPDPVQARKDFIARQPMGRLGTPEEVAELCLYLGSDESAFITGQALVIDGGWTL